MIKEDYKRVKEQKKKTLTETRRGKQNGYECDAVWFSLDRLN